MDCKPQMDEEDFDYVPSWANNQPSQPLGRDYRPVDREFAERIFKMFARPFDPSWKMPDLDGSFGPELDDMVARLGRYKPGTGLMEIQKPWILQAKPYDENELIKLYSGKAGDGDTSFVTQQVAGNSDGNGTLDRYRNNEIVPGLGNSTNANQDADAAKKDKDFNDEYDAYVQRMRLKGYEPADREKLRPIFDAHGSINPQRLGAGVLSDLSSNLKGTAAAAKKAGLNEQAAEMEDIAGKLDEQMKVDPDWHANKVLHDLVVGGRGLGIKMAKSKRYDD